MIVMKKTCKNHKLLLLTDFIFCNNPKEKGKILLVFCCGNQVDDHFQVGLPNI